MRETPRGFERGEERAEGSGHSGQHWEALHAVFTNPVHFVFGSWMCFIPARLIAVPATLRSVYVCEFLKHSQYLERQRMRLK